MSDLTEDEELPYTPKGLVEVPETEDIWETVEEYDED